MAKKDNKTRNILIGVGVLVLLIVFYVIAAFNSLVTLDNTVDNKWADVETQYQRRVDLIPNLVSTVKGYAAHEQELFTRITELRSQWAAAKGDINKQIQTANQLEGAIGRLLLVAENYPDLKASQNFLALQDELAGTENRIAVARQRYNEIVKNLNVKTQTFPSNVVANMFGFEKRIYFEAEEGSEDAPTVEF